MTRLLSCLCILLLSGCSSINGDTVAAALGEVDDTWQYARTRINNIIGGPDAHVQKVSYQASPGYCYRTLAQVDCYDSPQFGHEYRMVGYNDRERAAGDYKKLLAEAQRHEAEQKKVSEKRRQLAEERRKRSYKEELLAKAPEPVQKPVKREEDISDPVDLIRFRLGDKEFSSHTLPNEEELSF